MMKSRLFLCTSMAALMLALSGCSSTGATGVNAGTVANMGTAMTTATNVGKNIFTAAVDSKCRSEIEQHNAWRIASVAMNDTQQENIKTKVCGCVSEQAPQQVTLVEMGNAAIDPAYRTQLATKVVAKSLQSCYASFTK